MIHQPIAAFYEAQIGEFVLEAEELLKLREILTRVYAQRTGQTFINLFNRKTWKGTLRDQLFKAIIILIVARTLIY